MSVSHRPGIMATHLAAQLLNVDWVTYHGGPYTRLLTRHRLQVRAYRKEGKEAVDDLMPELPRIADERTLRAAWAYLSAHGGQAPGPDNLHYDDLDDSFIWQGCRSLRDEIRAGEYELGDERILWIPKGSGRGKRPLVLQSILERVVQRACVEIVQPLLDPQFDSRSFAFRPGSNRGPLPALALAQRLALAKDRHV